MPAVDVALRKDALMMVVVPVEVLQVVALAVPLADQVEVPQVVAQEVPVEVPQVVVQVVLLEAPQVVQVVVVQVVLLEVPQEGAQVEAVEEDLQEAHSLVIL